MYLAPTRTERNRGSLGRLPGGQAPRAPQRAAMGDQAPRQGERWFAGCLLRGFSKPRLGQKRARAAKASRCAFPCFPFRVVPPSCGPARRSPFLPRQKHGANKIVFTPRRNLTSAAAPRAPRTQCSTTARNVLPKLSNIVFGGRGGRGWLDFRKLVFAVVVGFMVRFFGSRFRLSL